MEQRLSVLTLAADDLPALAEPAFGGCYFLFADPEGNIWEVSYNPLMLIDQSGNVLEHRSIDNL